MKKKGASAPVIARAVIREGMRRRRERRKSGESDTSDYEEDKSTHSGLTAG